MAGYAHEILKNISDSKPLGAHLGKAPVHELFEAYKKLAENDDTIPLLTDENSGWDFKEALDQLSAEHQIALLYPYLRASSPQFEEEESPLEVRSRIRLREWFIRLFGYSILVAVALLVGATVTIAVKEGKAPSSEFLETFLEYATEVAKVLFESNKVP
jgi:hypothetical protein